MELSNDAFNSEPSTVAGANECAMVDYFVFTFTGKLRRIRVEMVHSFCI